MSEAEKSAIQKIKKLLALSKSSNEHEAALALQKAQELMASYQIGQTDIDLADIEECDVKATVKKNPVQWEINLFVTVHDAFGCRGLFRTAGWGDKGKWVFIGPAPNAEIAAYAFSILFRQCQTQRRAYIGTLKRLKPETKTKRGNLFASGWVDGVESKIKAFAGAPQQSAALDLYMTEKYLSVQEVAGRDHGQKHNVHDDKSFWDGKGAGRSAQLDRAVNGNTEQSLISSY